MMRHLRKVMKASREKECRNYVYTLWKAGKFKLCIRTEERKSKEEILEILRECAEHMEKEDDE